MDLFPQLRSRFYKLSFPALIYKGLKNLPSIQKNRVKLVWVKKNPYMFSFVSLETISFTLQKASKYQKKYNFFVHICYNTYN